MTYGYNADGLRVLRQSNRSPMAPAGLRPAASKASPRPLRPRPLLDPGASSSSSSSSSSSPGSVIVYVGTCPILLAETDGSGNPLTVYTQGPGGASLVSSYLPGTGASSYPLYDALGSLDRVTDPGQAQSGQSAYDAYGLPLVPGDPPLQYAAQCGYYYDADTGLYFICPQGWYDPQAKIWGNPLSLSPTGANNLYSFSGNSPPNLTSLTGGCPPLMTAPPCKCPSFAGLAPIFPPGPPLPPGKKGQRLGIPVPWTCKHSTAPTTRPTTKPAGEPTTRPASGPTSRPVGGPTSRPASGPTTRPASGPTSRPSSGPATQPTTAPEPDLGPAGPPAAPDPCKDLFCVHILGFQWDDKKEIWKRDPSGDQFLDCSNPNVS